MKWLARIFNFYINSSIHVALAVVCLTLISLKKLNLEQDYTLVLFIFFGTITGYNFVKYSGVARLHHSSLTDSLKIIQIFSLICFSIWIYYVFKLPFQFLLACLPLGFLTLFYAFPLFPAHKNLRRIPSLKIFVIAAVWAGATVYLPVIYHDLSWNEEIVIMLVQRFLIVLALIIPFEIRDFKYDDAELGTVPQRIGVFKTKQVGLFLLITFLVLEYFQKDLNYENLALALIVTIITSVAIILAKENQDKYYSSFWVEAIPIMWWSFYAIF
ncbi:MAG: hypothetical protein V7767_07455 [Leeuwenhoekiella sp.]